MILIHKYNYRVSVVTVITGGVKSNIGKLNRNLISGKKESLTIYSQ